MANSDTQLMHQAAAEKLLALYNNLGELIDGTELPPGRQVQLSAAYYSIVRDHHLAIMLLLNENLHASMFALLRPIYEALVKGIWITYCNTSTHVEKYAQKKELPGIKELIENIVSSELPAELGQAIRVIKDDTWQTLSSFAHAGHRQVSRLLSPKGIEHNFNLKELEEIGNFVSYIATVAAKELMLLGHNNNASAITYEF